MSYNDFLKESQHTLVKSGMVIYFYQINPHMWIIEVNLPGSPEYYEDVVGTNWHPATCSITSIEAHIIYENLINQEG